MVAKRTKAAAARKPAAKLRSALDFVPLGGLLVGLVIGWWGVFVLPWSVAVTVNPVVSDAQVGGYSNRVAVVALGIALVVAFASAGWKNKEAQAFLTTKADDGVVGLPTVLAGLAITLVVTVGMAWLIGGRPYGEGEYFVSRMIYLLDGMKPYSGFEFSYGPAMLYVPYLFWLALKPLGVGPDTAYYLVLLVARLGMLWVFGWTLNRFVGPAWLKRIVYLSATIFGVLQLGMGLEYGLARFGLPMVLLVWALADVPGQVDGNRLLVKALASTIVATLVSPEIGIAVFLALGAASLLLAVKRVAGARRTLVGLGVVLLLGLLGVSALATFMNFAGGGYYLPVIKSPVSVAFLLCALLVASGAGAGLLEIEPGTAAIQLAWCVLGTVLVAAAFGRADCNHLLWNGLPMFVAAPFVAARWWKPAGGAVAIAAVIAVVVVLFRFSVGIELAPYLGEAVASGTMNVASATTVATSLGVPNDSLPTIAQTGQSGNLTQAEISQVVSLGAIAAPAGIPLDLSERLAASHSLVSTYTEHAGWVSWSDVTKSMSDMDTARYLIVPAAEWEQTQQFVRDQARPEKPIMVSPQTASNPQWNGYLYGVAPFTITGKNAELDISTTYLSYLRSSWRPVAQVEGYVVLGKA